MPFESDVRQPRIRVLANDVILAGVISAEVSSNNYYAADRFRVDLQTSPVGANAWSVTESALLDIQFSLDGTSFTSIIQGEIDQLRLDPLSLGLTLEGRDLTSRFLQARTQETFANQTSSQIATTLAARRSLTANVTPTTTPVGAYWQLEHDRTTLDSFSHATTEWDLLVGLAGHEGFDVWVSASTLYFQPPSLTPHPTELLRLRSDERGLANIISLKVERSLALVGNIAVTVKSWNSRQAQSFTQTATSNAAMPAAQTYVFVVPNLTPDAALRLAQSRLAELTSHERVIDVEMPGELRFSPRQQVFLTGTNTAFDQTYRIDEITRRLDIKGGFTQRLRARSGSAPGGLTGALNWNAS